MDSVTQSAVYPQESQVRGWLEVLDRTGHVTQRLTVSHLPLTIGRSYENDVILDDPYVSPMHLRLHSDSENRLVADDLDSVNGLYRERERVSQIELTSGLEVRVGHTRLRYRDKDFQVPAPLVDFSVRSPLLLLHKPLVLVLVYVLTLGWLLLSNYLGSYEPVEITRLVAALVAPVAGILVWSGVWAFASRLLVHRLNFLIHCAIACLAGLGFSCLATSLSYLAFALNADQLEEAAQLFGNALIFALLLYAHLRFCSLAPPRRLVVTAAVLAVVAGALTVLETQVDYSEFSAAPSYHTTLKPPSFQWVSGEPIAAFFTDAEALRQDLLEAMPKEP
ncbi:MAG: FHA domain-containing protein [Candidatus Competibacteraceae bacterium]|jgi:hypothetical protein|nr:FHA domain-containing protein [Candidatus Competibacteraceae bacterium]